MRLKKAGNRLIEVIGGRSVHPFNVRVGGLHRARARSELRALTGELEQDRQDALETVRWMATFPFPDFGHDCTFVSPMRKSSRRHRRTSGSSKPTSAPSSPTGWSFRVNSSPWDCEQAVRSYDPCISCAAHFLDLRVRRT